MSKPTKITADTPNGRVYQGTQVVDHDLFRLELANMVRDISWSDVPDLELVPHIHFFHTVDSNGRRMQTSNAVGGHHHECEMSIGPDGVPTVSVSGPMKTVRQKVKGVYQRLAVPIEGDNHTHVAIYRNSQKIKVREANIEAAKFEAQVASRQQISVEGVVSQ